MYRWLCILVLWMAGRGLPAQSPYFPAGHEAEKLGLKYVPRCDADSVELHPAVRPYSRTDLHRLDRLLFEEGKRPLSMRELHLINNEWVQYPHLPDSFETPLPASDRPILNWFYRSPAHFVELYKENVYLQVDPMLHFEAGRYEDYKGLTWNRRGIRLNGGIDGTVGIYADIVETQARFAPYVNDRIDDYGAIPGQGLIKEYSSDFYGISGAYDFLNSRAHVAFPLTKHIHTRIGYGTHFFGYGQRSLLLSDYANNYAYLSINTRIWKLHYKNLFAQLHATTPERTEPNELLPKKYLAAHYLSFKGIENLELGLFEAVVFSRDNGFEWSYLIPVILYRTAEQGLGSPDNVLLGFNLGYTPVERIRLYGQVVLDEFVFDEWFGDNRDWWGNKAGLQIGLNHYDVLGFENWDAQLEWNSVRPYTYTHRDSSSNYLHYNQALAHPLGANFSEFIVKIDGRFGERWNLCTYLLRQRFGDDPEGENFGGNLLKSSDTRNANYGQELFQGIDTKRWILGGVLGYRLFPGASVESSFRYRSTDPVPEGELADEWMWTLGFRMNIEQSPFWF